MRLLDIDKDDGERKGLFDEDELMALARRTEGLVPVEVARPIFQLFAQIFGTEEGKSHFWSKVIRLPDGRIVLEHFELRVPEELTELRHDGKFRSNCASIGVGISADKANKIWIYDNDFFMNRNFSPEHFEKVIFPWLQDLFLGL